MRIDSLYNVYEKNDIKSGGGKLHNMTKEEWREEVGKRNILGSAPKENNVPYHTEENFPLSNYQYIYPSS